MDTSSPEVGEENHQSDTSSPEVGEEQQHKSLTEGDDTANSNSPESGEEEIHQQRPQRTRKRKKIMTYDKQGNPTYEEL